MSLQAPTQTPKQAPVAPTGANGVLERKCACGTHTTGGGQCAECSKKGKVLQRKASNRAEPTEVPPIVHNVLRSPGQPLDPTTRAFMEPRFQHDFSQVVVHTSALQKIQPKLTISQPSDRYEQEADRIAEQIMRMPDPQPSCVSVGGYPSGQSELIQLELRSQVLNNFSEHGGDKIAPAIVNEVLGSPGHPLDPATRAFFEPRFGHDFSQVRVHTGEVAERSTRDVNSLAYTVGHDVVFGAGRFVPGTTEGRRLLAHELTHVVQQTGANGICSVQSNGVPTPVNSRPAGSDVLQRTVDLAAVLRAIETGDWDVDSLAAQLSDEQMATLSTSNRVRLIRYIANGYSVLSSDEETILRLFRTTPPAHRTALVGALDAALLQRLESVLHGEEYRQYHVLLRGLFFGARSAGQAVREIESARTFPWADPLLIRAIWNRRFYYEVAEFTPEGRLRFVYWTNIAFMGVRNQAIEVDPMEMIVVRFHDAETEAGASRGQTIPMPAISLLFLVQKQFRGEMQTVADVALIGLGGAGLVGASTRLGLAIAALELAFGTADVVVRNFRPRIAGSERGREFLAVWDIVSALIALYGFTRLAIEGGRLLLRLRRAWRAFRGSDDALRLGDQLDPLRQKVDEVLDQADEARAAQQGGAPGTPPAPEGPTPTTGTTSPVPAGPAPTTGASPPAPAGPAPTTAISHPAPTARVDVRPVPLFVRTGSGVDVAIDANRLEHVLGGHTIENFDPVARAAEIVSEAPAHLTTFFRRGTVTNPRELYTLIRQALQGSAGRSVAAGANNRITLTLRNHQMEAWVGPAAGGGMRLNSIYPLASTGRNLTAAQIRAYAAEIQAGTRTLDQIRAEIARLLQ